MRTARQYLRAMGLRNALGLGMACVPAWLAVHTATLAAEDNPQHRRQLLDPASCSREEFLPDRLESIRGEIERLQVHPDKETAQWLNRELSSDHAGETGAVYIYHGALRALQVRASDCIYFPNGRKHCIVNTCH